VHSQQGVMSNVVLGQANPFDSSLTCNGKCGGESVGKDGKSCWCDKVCNEDCCADKEYYCQN